jgi:hypothetical protein
VTRDDAPASPPGRPSWVTCAVFGLVVMVTWTLVIKYLAPILYFVSERAAGRAPAGVPILWDFWWVAHLALAWLLWRRHRRAWAFGVAVSAIEIVIVIVKFGAYALAPDLSFWRLLWFTNKVYVLVFFVVLLVVLLRRREWLEPSGKTDASS